MSKTTLDWAFLTKLGSSTATAPAELLPEEPVEEPVQVIAGRYELEDLLGRGGGGQVYRARDRLTGEAVALKLLGSLHGEALARVRREITALRWLRLPGVVQLRDSGLWRGEYFLVMDLVEGRPFPGARAPSSWEAIASTTASLLEVLARVHMASVVHRDLKPANVLVDRQGRPVVLDFGLAQGRAVTLEAVRGKAEGTPAYVAPEQIRNGPTDARTDLYALGCMLYEALTGNPPHTGGPSHQILQRRLSQPAPPLHHLAPEVPERVARLIDRLLERDPQDRPGSAAEALEALGGHPDTLYLGTAADLPIDHVLSMEELRPLFAGPDPFLHLIEDGARVLHARTGGHPLLVREELGGWVRAGLAHWEDERLVISRAALERLERGLALTAASDAGAEVSPRAREVLRWIRLAWPDATPRLLGELTGLRADAVEEALAELRPAGLAWDLPEGRLGAHPGWTGVRPDATEAGRLALATPPHTEARLRSLLLAGAPTALLLNEVRSTAEALMEHGLGPRALALLEVGLDLLAADPQQANEAREEPLLRLYTVASLRLESEAAMERALYELGRASGRSNTQQALATLTLGSLAARRRESARALDLLDGLAPFDDGELESLRLGERVRAAAVLGVAQESSCIADFERTALLRPWLLPQIHGLRGNLLYRQGRMSEAAEAHLESLALRRRPDARLGCLVGAASALLDAMDLERALEVAIEARQSAAALRHARYEALATSAERSAHYRLRHPLHPDPELVAAAGALGAYLQRLFACTEAAIAWRIGERRTVRALAEQGLSAGAKPEHSAAAAMCAGLLLLSGEVPQSPESVAALERAAMAVQAPGLRVQILGLLGLATGQVTPHWRELGLAAAQRLSPASWSQRREVLSVEECAEALGFIN